MTLSPIAVSLLPEVHLTQLNVPWCPGFSVVDTLSSIVVVTCPTLGSRAGPILVLPTPPEPVSPAV